MIRFASPSQRRITVSLLARSTMLSIICDLEATLVENVTFELSP
jgi:hypothetical protein